MHRNAAKFIITAGKDFSALLCVVRDLGYGRFTARLVVQMVNATESYKYSKYAYLVALKKLSPKISLTFKF